MCAGAELLRLRSRVATLEGTLSREGIPLPGAGAATPRAPRASIGGARASPAAKVCACATRETSASREHGPGGGGARAALLHRGDVARSVALRWSAA